MWVTCGVNFTGPHNKASALTLRKNTRLHNSVGAAETMTVMVGVGWAQLILGGQTAMNLWVQERLRFT